MIVKVVLLKLKSSIKYLFLVFKCYFGGGFVVVWSFLSKKICCYVIRI